MNAYIARPVIWWERSTVGLRQIPLEQLSVYGSGIWIRLSIGSMFKDLTERLLWLTIYWAGNNHHPLHHLYHLSTLWTSITTKRTRDTSSPHTPHTPHTQVDNWYLGGGKQAEQLDRPQGSWQSLHYNAKTHDVCTISIEPYKRS
jgi:hypothetical protein